MGTTADPSSHLGPSIVQSGKPSSAGEMDGNPNPSHPQLKFLTTTGPPSSRSKEASLVVRSHAMQAFLHDKRVGAKGDAIKNLQENKATLDDSIGRFKLKSWSRKSSKKSPPKTRTEKLPGKNLNNKKLTAIFMVKRKLKEQSPQPVYASLDPFGLLPIILTSETHRLLYHYITTFTMNSLAVNPEGSWMAFAVTDAALLRATLSLVALHTDLINGREESWDCLFQKGEAIKEINQRLSDKRRQLNDTSIATVAILTNLESVNGTRQTSDVHMVALERMVRIRGGIDTFNHNKVLQRVLTWSDILYSSTWNCTPRFPLIQSSTTIGPTSRLERFTTAVLPHNLPDFAANMWCISNPGMCHILEMLRRISTAMPSSDLSSQDRSAISNNIYLLEHILLSSQSDSLTLFSESASLDDVPYEVDLEPDLTCNPPVTVEPDPFTVHDLSEAFRLAALLYMHLILRELPHTARMHLRLVSTLKEALETQYPYHSVSPSLVSSLESSISRQTQRTLKVLAWICFVAAAAAANKAERLYFINFLREICMQQARIEDSNSPASGIQPKHKEDLKRTLQGVAWRESVSEGYFEVLWGEMNTP